MREIEKAVSEVMQVPIEVMHTKTRKREVVWARQLTWKYAKATMKGKSLANLGQYFERDHATALHGIGRINDLLYKDVEIKELWSDLYNRLPSIHIALDEYVIIIKRKLTTDQLYQFCNSITQH